MIPFEKLNPIDNFEFFDSIDSSSPNNNTLLFKKAINNHSDLKEVIWVGIYHCLSSLNFKKECLTVLNKDFDIIADLLEGSDRNVSVPDSVKLEYQKGNVLATFHNHYGGSILPSINDFNNSILPKLNFTVITSKNIFGIIINQNNYLSSEIFQLLINDFRLFEVYLNFCFAKEEENNIKILKKTYNGKDFIIHREKLFNEYIFNNTEKFVEDFNNRMEKYNVYLIYIKF